MTERLAIAPLVGRDTREETVWLGASLSKLLTEHLVGAGLIVLDHNAVARIMIAQDRALPLDQSDTEALRRELKLAALIYGSFTLDTEGRLLGLRLHIDRSGQPRPPLEVSTPLASFGRFIERASLALIERLGLPVTDEIRRKVGRVPRPTSFEAYRQVVGARAAWARGEQHLALTQVEAALAMDPALEEATEIALAVAHAANDVDILRDTYRRWADLALGGGRPAVGAERLMAYGHWLVACGEWETAQAMYEEALDVFRRERNQSGEIRALDHLANLALRRGQFQHAAETYRRHAHTLEATGPSRDAAIVWHNLALALRGLGQTDEALDAIERALVLARQSAQVALEARCYSLRGAIRDDLGMWAAAQADYQQAERTLESVNDELGLAIAKDQLAGLYRQQGNYHQAETLRLEALALLEKFKYAHELAIVWLNLADLYFAMGNYAQAWEYASRAHQTLVNMGSGMANQARALVETLEPLRGTSPLQSQETSATPQGEGLYSDLDLYHNEDEDTLMTGGDEDENSAGRTTTL